MQTHAGKEMHSQPPGRRLILQVRWGPMASRKVLLTPGQVLQVGRAQAMGLALQHDVEMSNAHFELAWNGTECHLRDLKSTSGTLLGGERIEEALVQNGDWVRAGSTDFSIYFEGEPHSELDTAPAVPGIRDPLDKALSILSAQENLFAVLDAAQGNRVLDLLNQSAEEYQSLYLGTQGEALADVAPYLVSLPKGSPLLKALITEGWDKNWGVYLTCEKPFLELRKHFRKFLMVQAEGFEHRMYFRFYDPRVLQTFLPTCPPEQSQQFFGPILRFFFPSHSTLEVVSMAREPV